MALMAVLLAVAGQAIAADRVQGHVRKDGTYVQPYYRTSPNETARDNYSTRGNANPYTGRQGTVNPAPQRVPSRAEK